MNHTITIVSHQGKLHHYLDDCSDEGYSWLDFNNMSYHLGEPIPPEDLLTYLSSSSHKKVMGVDNITSYCLILYPPPGLSGIGELAGEFTMASKLIIRDYIADPDEGTKRISCNGIENFSCLTNFMNESGVVMNDLHGMEFCSALKTIKIRSAGEFSVAPLANLSLNVLNLSRCIVSEIEVIRTSMLVVTPDQLEVLCQMPETSQFKVENIVILPYLSHNDVGQAVDRIIDHYGQYLASLRRMQLTLQIPTGSTGQGERQRTQEYQVKSVYFLAYKGISLDTVIQAYERRYGPLS